MDKLIPLDLPPGVFAQGTRYQSKGRWFLSNLVRFFNGTIRPVGGWRRLRNTLGEEFPAVTGVPRGLLAWEVDDGPYQVAIGTTETLNLIRDDALLDITPDGFTVGGEEGEGLEEYGEGLYGEGPYGSVAGTTVASPGVWQMDNFGDVLLALYTGDGKLYSWDVSLLLEPALDDTTPIQEPEGGVTVLSIMSLPLDVADSDSLLVVVGSTATDPSSDAEEPIAVDYDFFGTPQSFGDPIAELTFNGGGSSTRRAWVYFLQNPAAGSGKDVRVEWTNAQAPPALLWVTKVADTTGYAPASVTVLNDQLTPGDTGIDFNVTSKPGNLAVAIVVQDGNRDMTPSAGTLEASYTAPVVTTWGLQLLSNTGAAPTAPITADFDAGTDVNFAAIAINFATQGAEVVAAAPEDNTAVVVTPEHFVFLLGAGGDVHKVQWASQATFDDWTPTSENSAGDFILSTNGRLCCGRRSRAETLLWTNVDLWKATYIGEPFFYRFDQAGNNCGSVSAHAPVIVDTKAFWMGQDNFFVYDGFVQTLPCEVHDYVFTNFNRTQREKVWSMSFAQFGEVWWFYPSGSSSDVDRYVAYNWREGHWVVGELSRSGGLDAGLLEKPVLADAAGFLYQHEYLDDRDDAVPFLESGPLEIGDGDRLVKIQRIIPDASDIDAVEVRLFLANYPTDTETEIGPFTTTQPTDVRAKARQIRVRIQEKLANTSWRIGKFRLGVKPSSRR